MTHALQMRKAAPHLMSIYAYLLTIPNIMGYVRAPLMALTPFALSRGFVLYPAAVHFLNQCVLDMLDGIIARRLHRCTSFGRVLDISTDAFVEFLMLGSVCYYAFGSTTLPSCMTGHGFAVCVMLYKWFDVVGCFLCIAVFDWKVVRYPCPITRWYYASDFNNNFLYMSFHVALIAVYLLAEGSYGRCGAVLLALTVFPALLRTWAGFVVTYVLLQHMRQTDVNKLGK
jgi:phosphatidylglycerophosphate synthase